MLSRHESIVPATRVRARAECSPDSTASPDNTVAYAATGVVTLDLRNERNGEHFFGALLGWARDESWYSRKGAAAAHEVPGKAVRGAKAQNNGECTLL